MDLKKIQNISEEQVAKFIGAATTIIMDEVRGTDEENIKTIIKLTARDMAMGAALKKNEHVLTGVGIGVIGTTLAFAIGSKFKRKEEKIIIVKEETEAFKETSASQSEKTETEKDKSEDIKVKTENKVKTEKKVKRTKQEVEDEINDILKKPKDLDDLKHVIKEIRKTDK